MVLLVNKVKDSLASSLEITVGSQVCLSTAPLYQVTNYGTVS